MHSVGSEDAVLTEGCAEALDLLANCEVGCDLLAQAEAGAAEAGAVEEVEHRLASARQQWYRALLRLSALPAHTDEGRLAKIGAVESYLSECPIEDPVGPVLIASVLMDFRRLLGDGGRSLPDP